MSPVRVTILVLDACGIGALPDAAEYGDATASTLPHVALAVNGLRMPVIEKLGLGHVVDIMGIGTVTAPRASFGRLCERSPGKDSTTGHWELAGVVLDHPFPMFPNGFPDSIVSKFERRTGTSVIGNVVASGTEIIERLGEEHLRTGKLILYTSADSVFQLAAHESICPVPRLYEICQTARDFLQGAFGVARVIARPFVGVAGKFTRTAARRDFSLPPVGETLLDIAKKAGIGVLSIGKIYDLFAGRGISTAIKTSNNDEVMSRLVETVTSDRDHRLIFANCVDFDMLWGHRNDVAGFKRGLEQFDIRLGQLLSTLKQDDVLIITADHGCDPTITSSTDHTREYVPLLICGDQIKPGRNLGTRSSFADVAASAAEALGIALPSAGRSFWAQVTRENSER